MMFPLQHGRARGPVRARAARPGVESMEARQLLATFTVTSTNDSGPGSLRQAILDADNASGSSVIDFQIGTGAKTIIPASPLPLISSPVTLDATTQPGYAGTPLIELNGSQIFYQDTNPPNTYPVGNVAGLVVSASNVTIWGFDINRFTGPGILLSGGGHDVVAGNNIGTDPTGTVPLGNGGEGILITSRFNLIGGTSGADRNIISANSGVGIAINSSGYTTQVNAGNVIQGNLIGTDAGGTLDLGNAGGGVSIFNSGKNVVGTDTPGGGNVIAFNGSYGVQVYGGGYYNSPSIGAQVLSNAIFANANQGISLGYGVTSPVAGAQLSAAYEAGPGTTVEGSFVGSPGGVYLVQFFATPQADASYGTQGKALLGTSTYTADASGIVRFTTPLAAPVPVGQQVSATATDVSGNTSAFFGGVRVASGPSADLGISVAASSPTIAQGSGLTYTIVVANGGPATATGVVVSDALPPGTVVTSVNAPDGTVVQANGVVSVGYDRLYPGAAEVIQVNVIAAGLGTVTNHVAVTANQPDPTPSNSAASVDTVLTLNLVAPFILAVRQVTGLRAINAIELVFSEPLNQLQALNPINYSLLGLGRNHKFSTSIPFTLGYNPTSQTVTLRPTRPLALGQPYQLTVDGVGSAGVTDLAGNLLVGNTDAGPLGPWVTQVGRGFISTPVVHPKPPAHGHFSRTIDTVLSRHVQTTSAP